MQLHELPFPYQPLLPLQMHVLVAVSRIDPVAEHTFLSTQAFAPSRHNCALVQGVLAAIIKPSSHVINDPEMQRSLPLSTTPQLLNTHDPSTHTPLSQVDSAIVPSRWHVNTVPCELQMASP